MWEYAKYMLSTLMARVWTCPLTPKILKISFLVRCVKNIYLGFYYWKSFTTGSHYTVVCGLLWTEIFPESDSTGLQSSLVSSTLPGAGPGLARDPL